MSMPYVVSEAIWNTKDASETAVLKTEFELCQATIIEFATTGFSGTIDIQGKAHELGSFANIPYIRQDQAGIQTPSVSQLSLTTDTGTYRYVILGYWRRFQLVMTRTAGSITCAAIGSSSAKSFPYLVTKLIANSGVDIGDVDILSIAAGSNKIGSVDGNITKTIQTELKIIAAVAADVQDISSTLDLSGQVKKVAIFIDHAKDHASASVGQGTEYVIQVSEKASGNDTWRSLAAFVASITAPTAMISDAEEAAGQTVIECGATVPAVGDILFFKNATIGSSEWANVIARVTTGGSETVTLESGLTAVQAQGTYYTQGEHFVVIVDVEALTRLRIVCNNTKGTTNRAIVWRCAAITMS